MRPTYGSSRACPRSRNPRLVRAGAAVLLACLRLAAGAAAQPPAPAGGEPSFRAPDADELFRVESEASFKERLRRDAPDGHPVPFPPETRPAVPGAFVRFAPPVVAAYEPAVFCHRPLYFRDPAVTSSGGFVGPAQPILSTGRFYLQTLLLPVSLAARPPWLTECDTIDAELPPCRR